MAAAKGHSEAVGVLLQHGARVDAQDNQGCTALLCAATWGHLDVLQELLESHADVHLEEPVGLGL